jgi:hypothetical protein
MRNIKILKKIKLIKNKIILDQLKTIEYIICEINIIFNDSIENLFLDTLVLRNNEWINSYYSQTNNIDNITNFPWIDNFTIYWKNILSFIKWYNLIKNNKKITKKDLLDLNNIIRDTNFTEILKSWKKIVKWWKIIHITPQWVILNRYISEYLYLLNNWYNNNFLKPYFLAYLNYIFLFIHPFNDWNWRMSRILTLYQLTNVFWLKVPWIFIHFYINSNKEYYYNLLKDVDLNKSNSLINYSKWFNELLIIELNILKTKIQEINEYKKNILIEYFNNDRQIIKYLDSIYSSNYFILSKENNEINNIINFLCDMWIFKFYIFNWKQYYFDNTYLKIFKY